jgi:two-component system nitrate/nitrite response regulator NarL
MITTEATAPNRLTGLVEDENVTRAYWEQLLRSQPGLDFRRSWSSAEDFLADASHSEVELLLVDLELPGASGQDLIRRFKKEKPDAICVVLTVSSRPEDVFEAIRSGASGYLVKGSGPEVLLSNLQNIVNDGMMFSPGIARLFVEEFLKGGPAIQPSPQKKLERLTPRELEVLRAVQQFGNAKDVAVQMGLSHETVRVHMKKVYQKLHVRSKTEAIAMLAQASNASSMD